jgi:hypothetical protein
VTPVVLDDFTRDLYEVQIRESAFGGGRVEGAAAAPLPGLEAGPSAGTDALAMLALQMPEVGRYLVRYDVEVRWEEAEGPERVARTTFAFDWESAGPELAALMPGGAGAQPGGAGDADGRGEDSDARGDSARDRNAGGSASDRRSGSEPPSGSDELTVEQMKCMLGIGPC